MQGKGLTEQEVNTSTSHSSNSKLADVSPDPGGGLGTKRWQEANKPSPNSPHEPSTALGELSLLDCIDSGNIKVGKFTFVPASATLNLKVISAPLPRVLNRLLVGAAFAFAFAAFTAAFAATTTTTITATPSTFAGGI